MRAFWVLALSIALGAFQASRAEPVKVRYAEGITHGYLQIRGTDGALLGHGDEIQTGVDGEFEKHMTLQLKDGSVYDEKAAFTQKKTFALKAYSLSMKGPAFETDQEISLDPATGHYRVVTKDHKGGHEKVTEGKVDLPDDVYNGMTMTIAKDLPKGASAAVHYVAFTPKARVIELAIVPVEDAKVAVGERTKNATHYVLKPRLGKMLKVFAKLTGRDPGDANAWIMKDDTPTFVGFEGALVTPGPTWRIETVSPSVFAKMKNGT